VSGSSRGRILLGVVCLDLVEASSCTEIKYSMFWSFIESVTVITNQFGKTNIWVVLVGMSYLLVFHAVSCLVTATGSDSSALNFSLGVWFANFDLKNPDTLSIGQHTFPNAPSRFCSHCERI